MIHHSAEEQSQDEHGLKDGNMADCPACGGDMSWACPCCGGDGTITMDQKVQWIKEREASGMSTL